jgi:hypothetical protein
LHIIKKNIVNKYYLRNLLVDGILWICAMREFSKNVYGFHIWSIIFELTVNIDNELLFKLNAKRSSFHLWRKYASKQNSESISLNLHNERIFISIKICVLEPLLWSTYIR